jgi:hypothetical protein
VTQSSETTPSTPVWERPELADYPVAYVGPEQLRVYVAHNKAEDHAFIRILGINHPLDGHIYWAELHYKCTPKAGKAVYRVTGEDGRKRTVLSVIGETAILKLPNWRGQERAKINLTYSLSESQSNTAHPENLIRFYKEQIGVTDQE